MTFPYDNGQSPWVDWSKILYDRGFWVDESQQEFINAWSGARKEEKIKGPKFRVAYTVQCTLKPKTGVYGQPYFPPLMGEIVHVTGVIVGENMDVMDMAYKAAAQKAIAQLGEEKIRHMRISFDVRLMTEE